MKKIILLLLISYSAWCGTLNQVTGVCIYNWYGAGGHQGGVSMPLTISGYDLLNASGKWVSTIRALPQFKLQRAFVDNWIVVPDTVSNHQTFTLKTEPTEQNFYFDSFFRLQKANGVTNIWSASGCFDWYKKNLGSFSQRKTACYDPTISPTNPNAWLDLAHLCQLIAQYYKDKNLLDYIQVLNEWDFRWNVPHILTPQEYAVGFRMCYKAIRAVSPNQKIMTGATLTADMATARLLIQSIDSVFVLNGETPPRDYVYTVNNYIRTNDNNQGNGIGATPESVDRYNVFFKPLNDFCVEKGLIGFAITETGYNTSPSTSASAIKNKAPALEGYTLEQAQGILAIRTALILASLPKCVGVTFYHCKDGYEAEPFTYHGFNYDNKYDGKVDWSAKPGRLIVDSFLIKYGIRNVNNFRHQGDLYGADLIASTDTVTIVWTDQNKSGNYDAMPRIGKLITPPNQSPSLSLISPQPGSTFTALATIVISANANDQDGTIAHVDIFNGTTLLNSDNTAPYSYSWTNVPQGSYSLVIRATDNQGATSTINNINVTVNAATGVHLVIQNHLLYWSDGTQVHIIEANSPETCLAYLDYNWLNWLNTHNVNTIYASCNGKEAGKVHVFPWKDENNLSLGFDDAKVNSWVAFAQYWVNLNPKHIWHLLLSEAETHNLYTDAQNQSAMQYLATKFAPINGKMIIDREEVPNGWGRLNSYYDYEKQVFGTNAIRAIHDKTGENPWSGNYSTDRIQFLSFQADVSAFDSRIRTEVAKNPNWAGYASEMTGGFQPNDAAKAQRLIDAAPGYNSGYGVYVACCDQRDTHDNWYTAYAPDFLAYTNTPPPPPTLKYSTSSTRSPANSISSTLTAGNYYIFVDGVTTSTQSGWVFTLYKNGTQAWTHTENSLPIDMVSSTPTAYNFTVGTWRLVVTHSGTTIFDVTFTVQ